MHAIALRINADENRVDAIVADQASRSRIKRNHNKIILVSAHRGCSLFIQQPHDAAGKSIDAQHLADHGRSRAKQFLLNGCADHAHSRTRHFFRGLKEPPLGKRPVVGGEIVRA